MHLVSFSTKLRGCLLLAALLSLGGLGTAYAQGPITTGPTPSATTVPLDGGASLLLVAGVGLGLRRLRESRQRRKH